MLPAKISNLLTELTQRTENGSLIWDFDGENESVSARFPPYAMTVKYSFNMIEEVGQYNIILYEDEVDYPRYFMTNQMYNDYDIARRLFDSAQTSGLNFTF